MGFLERASSDERIRPKAVRTVLMVGGVTLSTLLLVGEQGTPTKLEIGVFEAARVDLPAKEMAEDLAFATPAKEVAEDLAFVDIDEMSSIAPTDQPTAGRLPQAPLPDQAPPVPPRSTTPPAPTSIPPSPSPPPPPATPTTQPTSAPSVESSRRIWLSQTELAARPTTGPAWSELVAAAEQFDASMIDYGWQDSTDGAYALAAAFVAARTGDERLRNEVADALASIAGGPYVTERNRSALGWARNITSWIVAGDLIELAELRPNVDAQWRAFLSGMVTFPYQGDGGDDLLDLATSRANNIGAMARTAVTAIASYTRDTARLQLMADLYRAWVEGSAVHRFDWTKDKDRSWQCQPDDPLSFVGINPECMRDGNELGGVLAEEFRRSGPYDAVDFPGTNETKYPWEALGAAITQAELLRRAGYPDALLWGQSAPLRALERLDELHKTASGQGWTFGNAAGGGSDDRWIIPLVNALYGARFPEPSSTGPGRPMSWSSWSH